MIVLGKSIFLRSLVSGEKMIAFVYDTVGRLTRATDSVPGAIDFFYDNLDRLILEENL